MEKSRLKFRTRLLAAAILLIGAMTGCNEIATLLGIPQGRSTTGRMAVVLSTDFVTGTMNLFSLDDPGSLILNATTTHSDAVVRSFDNILYVVNRLGADNIQIVDPGQNFKVTLNCSVGKGTNPQEIIVVSSTKAYVTLYQPDSNKSQGLTVGDVLVVNPSAKSDCSDFITRAIDLTSLTAATGDHLARASSMVIVGNNLFVGLQDVSPTFAASHPGKIAVIDTKTDAVADSITETGRNPVTLNYSPVTNLIYVANADFADMSATGHGGIEVVDPMSHQTRGLLINEVLLGGAPGDIEVSGKKIYTTVSSLDPSAGTRVVSFDLDPNAAPDVTLVYQGKAFIQDIGIDEDGKLVIGDWDPKINGLVFIDPATNAVAGNSIPTGGSPMSMTFIER